MRPSSAPLWLLASRQPKRKRPPSGGLGRAGSDLGASYRLLPRADPYRNFAGLDPEFFSGGRREHMAWRQVVRKISASWPSNGVRNIPIRCLGDDPCSILVASLPCFSRYFPLIPGCSRYPPSATSWVRFAKCTIAFCKTNTAEEDERNSHTQSKQFTVRDFLPNKANNSSSRDRGGGRVLP